MIVKVYVKKVLFHLPRNQNDLTEMVKEEFYKRKPLDKSGFSKLYQIAEIENEEIAFDKKVNLFLVNLYLLVLEKQKKLESADDIGIELSDGEIMNEISSLIGEDVQSLPFDKLEERIEKYLSGESVHDKPAAEKPKETSKKEIPAVEFNMSWIRKADRIIRE